MHDRIYVSIIMTAHAKGRGLETKSPSVLTLGIAMMSYR